MSDLIDRALEEIQAPTEVSKTVALAGALTASDTSVTLTGEAEVTNVIEFGSELVLVTAKSSDEDPTYTFQRGYYGTTAAAHDVGAIGYLDPQFPRSRALNAVRRAFERMEAMGVPLVKSTLLMPEESPFTDDTQLILDPGESVREILDVRRNLYSQPNWEFIDNVPTTELSSGNLIRLRWAATLDDEYTVVYRVPYRWANTPATSDVVTEDSTIEVPEGTEFLPPSYAAAWLCQAREVSRHDLDRVAEWTEGEPTRAGVSARMVQSMWQKFYRELDEVRRLNPVPKRRPYMRRPKARQWTASNPWSAQ